MRVLLRIALSLFVLEIAFAIHEYGHLVEFQERNVPIQEFSLGIGPTLFQYQTPSFPISLRVVPIMAYVAPTEEGGELFAKQGSNWDKIVVSFAGVRNNLLAGLSVVAVLQVVGWRYGNISLSQLVKTLLLTPIKLFLRFLSFLLGCATWGKINLAKRFLLSTAGIKPPSLIEKFIRWNLVLVIINLVPIPPLDGSKIAQAVLASTGADAWMPNLPGSMFFVLFIVFFVSIGEQDHRLLEEEAKADSS